VQKGWSFFFGAVLLAELVLLIISPAMGWWLPENISTYGGSVDLLFYVILGFTGFFFVLTEAVLVYNMYAFAYREGHRAQYVEGNNRLELAWTIVPAAILLYIAFAQIKTWEEIKYQSHMDNEKEHPTAQVVQVTAHQWEWRMRYYGAKEGDKYRNRPVTGDGFDIARAKAWADSPDFDDYHGINELHTWKGAKVRIYLKTRDVIHSFFMPNMRLKQDALPGRTIAIWFRPIEANCKFDEATGTAVPLDAKTWRDSKNEWELACAELCGGGHYRMRGLLYVHETKDDYLKWLKHAQDAARSREPGTKGTPVAARD